LRVRAAAAYAEASTLNDAAVAEDATGAEPSATDAADEALIRAALQKPISFPKNTASAAVKPDSKPSGTNPDSTEAAANNAATIMAPVPAPSEATPQATDKTAPEIAATDPSAASRPAQANTQPVPATDNPPDKPTADSAAASHATPTPQSGAAPAMPALAEFVKTQLAPLSPRVSAGPAVKPNPAANSGKTAASANANSARTQTDAAKTASADSTPADSAPVKDVHSAEPQASDNPSSQAAQPLPQHMAAHPSSDTAPPALQPQIAANTAGIDAPVHVEVRTLAGQTQPSAGLNDLAFRIAAKSEAGESEFTLRLDPPDLGGIEVKLHVDAQGQAQASLTADKPQTLDLLQRDAGVLERTLKDAGLDLGGGLSFSLKSDGGNAQWHAPEQTPMRRAEIAAVENGNAAAVLAVTAANGWGGQTRLDIRI
jgi:flagellar hook-length control protein FliK